MSRSRWIWTGMVVAASVSGCGAPKPVPVAPPGMEYSNEAPEKPEDTAEAIGEMRGQESLAPAPPAAEPTKVGESKALPSG